jgi:uncharacterized membrane protein YhaH (DUF805 family)
VIEYLKGRSGRKEYWASIVILLLVGIGLAFANVAGASGVTTFLGKSAAWVLAPLGAMIVVTVVALLLGGDTLMEAARYAETGKGAISQSGETEFFALVMALLAVQAGFTIWLGAKAGDAGDNRFGPPPKDLLAR